jgi:diguanylate cyclase (GGDEF)-like protein
MALSIRHLRVRYQILLVTLPPLFALLCAVGLFFSAYWIAVRTERISMRSEESIARAQSLLRHVTELFMGVQGVLTKSQPSLPIPYETIAADISEDARRLRDLESDDPSHVAEVNSIQEEIGRFQTDWAAANLAKLKEGEAVDVPAALQEGYSRVASIRARALKLLAEGQAENVSGTHEVEQVMRRMLLLGVSVAILLAAVLLLLTRAVTRLIVQPLRQLIRASEQVSRGDFQPTLPPALDNEFGVLSRSFSHMTAALHADREEIEALNKFSEVVTQCTSEREVYDHLLHALKERFAPRQVIIFKLNPEENFLEAAATLAPLPEDLRAWPVIEEPHNCKAVRSGRSFRVNDVTLEPLCPARFVPPTAGSYYCGPLIAGGIIIGAVRLEGQKDFWTPERERLLESYLSGAATALSNLRLLETMKQQANVDVLTGLYNRRFVEHYARKLIAMARRWRQPIGLIMLDLDHFKNFNDVYGHEVGDRILRQFAKTVTSTMREANLAARFGGEEFVVLLPDTGPKACMLVAERVRQAVARMVVPSGSEKPLPQVTVSLGIAVFPEHGQSLEEVLQASDKALYESKHAGRNRTTLYAPQAGPAE